MFCWGDASRGQLLLPAAEEHFLTKPTLIGIIKEPIVGVSCGENHTLILAENGRVFSCGRNSKGQLGRAKSKENKLPVIEGLGGVAAVACGQEHSLALCDSGQVFSWGAGGEGQLGLKSPVAKSPKPVLVPITSPLQIPVVQVACGNVHSLALSKGGEVYAWGQNSHGQLGLGKSFPLQPFPALIPALNGVPVIQISAGGAHTMALSLTEQVFCCGANSAGQLGLNRTDEKGRFGVCAVPALKRLPIAYISCGAAHTAVLTKDGEVYTFGDGAHGQLGHNSANREILPRKVEDIDGPAKQVACGSHHTLVLMPSGVLYAFGQGVKGQLGNGSREDSLQPVRMDEPWKDSGVEILTEMKICSGWNSNFLFFPPPKPSVLGETIGRLDKAKVQRWVSMLERDKSTKEAKREICLTFSTSSSIVACFLKDSGAVGRNAAGTLTVDIDAASQTFDKLLKIPWIRNEIILKPVVYNLFLDAPMVKCPEIFLLLPTCSILHEEQVSVQLVPPLALAITRLNETTLKILKEQLCAMEAPMMSKHITMWKRALSFLLRGDAWLNFVPGVKAVLEVLKYLHRANKRAEKSRKVPISEFYVEAIGTNELLLQEDITLWRQIKWGEVEECEMTPPVFCRYPFLLDLQSKIRVLNYDSTITKMTHHVIHNQVRSGILPEVYSSCGPLPIMLLKLRRTALLEDTFRHLSVTDHDNFKKELVVHFVEDSIQAAVNQRDFFLNIFNELISPESEMFMYNDSQTMIWFPSKPKVEAKHYFLFGLLCGLALNNSNIVHLPFPLAMFKKLVNMKPTLDDLIEFSPVIGGSLRYLLYDYTDDDVQNMELSFCVHWDGVDVELDPQERGKLVTSDNKKKFVEAYVDYTMNKSVERVFEEFRRGFYKVCDRDVVEFFQPEELRGVMAGTEEYDWDVFRQNTTYEGQYHVRHPTIIAFWEVFEELTDEQKKAFLLFLTGCDRVPILGMERVKMTISVLLNSTQDHLPESLTCHLLFMLPDYENKQRLQDKLVEALNHNRGFWRE